MRSRCVRFCWLPTISCCRCCKAPVGVCWHQRRLRLETTWTISAGKLCKGWWVPLGALGMLVGSRGHTCCRRTMAIGHLSGRGLVLERFEPSQSFRRQSLPVLDTLVNPDAPCLVRSSVANGFIPSSPGRGAVLTDCWWIVLAVEKAIFARNLSANCRVVFRKSQVDLTNRSESTAAIA